MSSFADYKKNRKSSLSKLTEAVTKLDNNQSFDDDRFWYPKRDEAGNAYAVIRFLDCNQPEPFVRYWEHSFKGPKGKWYIEKSLTSIGLDDPCGDYNTQLWNLGTKEAKDQVSNQKRKLNYVSNILVIEDQKNPENNGKVFLFKYGKKIFDMIKDKMVPSFADEVPVNVFDLFEGANFKLKVRKVEGYPNYEKSEFMEPAPIFDDEKKIEEVFKQIKPLSEFIDPAKYETYDKLKKKLYEVLDLGDPSGAKADEVKENVVKPAAEKAAAPKAEKAKTPDPVPAVEAPIESAEDNEDEAMSFFKNLAEDE